MHNSKAVFKWLLDLLCEKLVMEKISHEDTGSRAVKTKQKN